LFRDPSVGSLYRHDSPYTYFTSSELHLGEISLECSRAGASAVALWATQKLLPLQSEGEFARGLERCREAALALHQRLSSDSRFWVLPEPELDIVVWAPAADSLRRASEMSRALFAEAARRNLHLAMSRIPATRLGALWPGAARDQESVTCLRSCLMKSEHRDWIDAIWNILNESMNAIIPTA
jgi:glutamate/tyrosine decarboxylase-like PLP-dependent enzyme